MAENLDHYCMFLEQDPEVTDIPAAGRTRGFVLNANRWQRSEEVTIRFLDGDPGLQQRVADAAREWLDYANLRFNFVDEGRADIRIAFTPGNGSWSYLGTYCRQIPDPEPTMNYGWLTPDSDHDELRRVVLHEFGHALGMIHEHQNPVGGIQWNKPAVIADLSGPPNNWSAATIETNMFRKYDPSQGTYTPFDRDSIMLYPIPRSWTQDGFSADMNSELSDKDKLLMEQVYPR